MENQVGLAAIWLSFLVIMKGAVPPLNPARGLRYAFSFFSGGMP